MKLRPIDVSSYGPVKLPSLSPHVIVSSEASLLTCKEIVAEMQAGRSVKSGVYDSTDHVVNEYYRASDFVTVSKATYDRVESIIVSAVTRLCVHQISAKAIWLGEPLQFLCYRADNSGHFNMHTDSAYFDAHGNFCYTSPQRILTAVLYLNDDFEGGEIEFGSVTDDSGRNFQFKPFAGALTVFPSDLRFPHEAKPVTSGNRYCVVAWLNVSWRE